MFRRSLTVMLLIVSTPAFAQAPSPPQPTPPVISPSPALSVLQADFTRVTQDINAVLLENQNKLAAVQKELDDTKAYWAAYMAGLESSAALKK